MRGHSTNPSNSKAEVIELITNIAVAYAGMNSLIYPTGTVTKGSVAQNAASKTSTTARTNRFWLRLGGSVASRTCCSFSAPVAPRAGIPARAPRDVPFCAIVGNFNFYARLLSPFR